MFRFGRVAMSRPYSTVIAILLLVFSWTIFNIGYEILAVKNNSVISHKSKEQARRTDDLISKTAVSVNTQSVTRTKVIRRTPKETENITTLKDTVMKQLMTKFIPRREAETQVQELTEQLNRLFKYNHPFIEHVNMTEFKGTLNKQSNVTYNKPSNATEEKMKTEFLGRLLDHMKRKHSPKSYNYGFNVSTSNKTPVNRTLFDFREDCCKSTGFNLSTLPKVSVITPFHNEALSMLLRHVHAVLNTSPDQVLMEFILVDDRSTLADLGADLGLYLKVLDKRIKLIRNKERQGVAKSRMIGADMAAGDVLVFLDSHVECTIGWLEPLLDRLMVKPKAIVQPILPNIFILEQNGREVFRRGAFTWTMEYIWSDVPVEHEEFLKPGVPVPTPTLTGCAIAVRRDYFYHLGGFWRDFEIWGGEHFELAFRNWMCGGTVEMIRCSVVGHLYKMLTYDFMGDANLIKNKNTFRVAEVWMDEYKEFVYAALGSQFKQLPRFSEIELTSIEERRQLRKRLKCGTFKQYLNMFPDIPEPSKDYVYFGSVRFINTSHCLVVHANGDVGVGEDYCGAWRLNAKEQFVIDTSARLKFGNECVGIDTESMFLKASYSYCMSPYRDQWTWELNPGPTLGLLQLNGPNARYCAVHDPTLDKKRRQGTVRMVNCTTTEDIRWEFAYKFQF